MAKKKKDTTYPNFTPSGTLEITKEFIASYFQDKLKNNEIGIEEYKEWIQTVKQVEEEYSGTPIKVFHSYRAKFAEKYFPHLADKKPHKTKKQSFSALLESFIDNE